MLSGVWTLEQLRSSSNIPSRP